MSGDEDKVRQLKSGLSEFGLRSLNLADFTSEQENLFHQYIKGICQRLLGDTLDLDKQNIIFALSDKNEVNAACVREGNTDIIYITRPLLDLCRNEDQLAFILGHELGHYEERLRQGEGKTNSKAEETACDLRAIQKMARGGYNLEEACNIAVELFDRKNISIEDLRDPHTNNSSRVNLVNAMKKKERDRVIEEQNVEITQSTPLAENIMKLVQDIPSKPSLSETLLFQMNQISAENNEAADDKMIAFWMKSFHEHVVLHGNHYEMTKDDSKAFAGCIEECSYNSDKFVDKFLAAVLADMENMRNTEYFQTYTEIMHNVLDEIRSSDSQYSHTKIEADEKDSKTAAWLRRYLHGFREAEGPQYDNVIDMLGYVKRFVARHNYDSYKGIYVKNFNLLELEFNENDIGKKLSPQILKYIISHINAYDKFVTFSGLTAHKMGTSLVLTHEKNNWSIFVDSSGEIAYSFPAQNLADMQTLLMKRIIETAKNNIEAVANGEISDFQHRLKVLSEAHKIILPVSYKNDLKSILETHSKKEDTKSVLYDDVMAVLSPEAQQFFNERIAESADNLSYTQKIIDLYADTIRTAPKEYFNEISESLVTGFIRNRLSGEDKLMRAFLDNPAFNERLSELVKSYEAFPQDPKEWGWEGMRERPDFDTRYLLLNMIDKMHEITDFKLKEHLECGGNFDNFEQPFKEDLAELFGFAPKGDIDEQTALYNLNQTRNILLDADITLYEEAYVAFSSYDALKSNTDTNIGLLLGYNAAGVKLKKRSSNLNQYVKSPERYDIAPEEQIQIAAKQQKQIKITDMIHDRLAERINQGIAAGYISAQDVFEMTLRNDYHGDVVNGRNGFETIIANSDFEKFILHTIENGKADDILNGKADDILIGIYSLNHVMSAYDKTRESDAHKEEIWPSVSKVFERKDISTERKTKIFKTLSYYNIFASDCKRYYEVLIGKDGKSGLLSEINKLEDYPVTRYECYEMLLDRYSRVPDPEIRADIVKNMAQSIWQANNSYDDITALTSERAAMIEEINYLKSSPVSDLDKIEILKELAELTMSQKELSLAMKPDNLELQVSDSKAIATAFGVDVFAYALQNYPETKAGIQDFLLGEGNYEEAVNLVKNIQISLCKEHDKYKTPKILDRYLNGEDILDELGYYASEYFNKLNPQSCLHFKKEFDAAPLEMKALIVNEIITNNRNGWVQPFQTVSEKLFSDAGELGKVGSDFLYSYISARPNSEKTFYLAAMMAAANNKSKSAMNYSNSPYTKEERNLAKGLRLFLENSGPAGTKLAQAMSSYTEVPEFIRYEMQFAKSEANPPARWEFFSGNDETMDKLSEYGALGKRRGSASFFVTYDLGDKIVKIMRRGAKLKADNEFAIYTEMLQTLSSEYENISSFKRLVQNAAENVHIETDLQIGEQQYLEAKKIYPKEVTADNITFKIQVMDWLARGDNWAIMDKAQGVDFKELSEPYKTTAAKAVFTTELANMLSGKRFDFDRHGGQYKFDTANNVIGVFDTGSMSMVEPTDKDRRALGAVLARTLCGLHQNQNIASLFSSEIDKVTKEFYRSEIAQNKPVPPYLSEFQRGMLALNDFYTDLSAKDMAECMIKAMDNGKNKIHSQIVASFKMEIKKSLDSHNISINNLLNPEKADNLAPEARANRRIGKILFDTVFDSFSKGKSLDISSDNAQKLVSRINNTDDGLQIVKGVVRGAYAKLNPENYTQEDRKELGMFLYHVCNADMKNQKLKKGEALENIITEAAAKYPQMSAYTQNIMKFVSVMAKIPALSDNNLKKAAAFVAFSNNDVAKGFKKALDEDKNIAFARRMMLKLVPMDFIPHNAKKMLIKSVNKHFVVNYISEHLLGLSPKLSKGLDKNI